MGPGRFALHGWLRSPSLLVAPLVLVAALSSSRAASADTPVVPSASGAPSAPALATAAAAASPTAVILDRVIAVVGRDIILLSELRKRESPFVASVDSSATSDANRAAKHVALDKAVFGKMLADMLEADAASAMQVSVAPAEIDAAIQNMAKANNTTPANVVAHAAESGLSLPDFRTELSRQILEGKLLALVLARKGFRRDTKMTDAEWAATLDKERTDWLNELEQAIYVDVRF